MNPSPMQIMHVDITIKSSYIKNKFVAYRLDLWCMLVTLGTRGLRHELHQIEASQSNTSNINFIFFCPFHPSEWDVFKSSISICSCVLEGGAKF